jgi:MoxR-like ATPase
MYQSDVEAANALQQKYKALKNEIARIIVGQHEVVEGSLISILCNGHSLLVGVPGLAKTLLVNTIAQVLDLGFKRIQFTPDLMPSDITGAEILDEHRNFKFIKGPLFSNIILADEINRTPPKTQAALLEAMQERQITIGENTYVDHSIIKNSIIGSFSQLEDVVLFDSLIGNDASLKGLSQSLNLGDSTAISFS